jgi:hypothetical protein
MITVMAGVALEMRSDVCGVRVRQVNCMKKVTFLREDERS